MKSVIQEASSVSKAIEQAWQKAGMPKEFSVKIHQEAHRNFLGMIKQTAKIALFFDERPAQQQQRSQQPQRQQQRPFQQRRPQNRQRRQQFRPQPSNQPRTQQQGQPRPQQGYQQIPPQQQPQSPRVQSQTPAQSQPFNRPDQTGGNRNQS